MEFLDDAGRDVILAAMTISENECLFHPTDEVIDSCIGEMPIGISNRFDNIFHPVADERKGPIEEIRDAGMVRVQLED